MEPTSLYLNQQLGKSWIWYHKKPLIWFLMLLLLLAGLFKYVQHYNKHQDIAVNQKFHVLLYAISINDNLTAKMHAEKVLAYSDRTPYPRLAGILLAKVHLIENDLIAAAKVLNSVIARKKQQDQVFELANLRLAKVLLLQNKLVEAEKIIARGLASGRFNSKYQELSGDLLVISNKLNEANLKYKQALQNLPENTMAPWLELKLQQTASDQDVVTISS